MTDKAARKPFLITSAAIALYASVLLAPQSMAASKEVLSTTEATFVKQEIAFGAAKVKLAELGVKKAENSNVRAFAEGLFTKHTKANEEWSKLAESKGLDISSDRNPAHAGVFQKLEKTNGAEFDKAFLSEMLTSHKQRLNNYAEMSKEANDIDLKARLDQMTPDLTTQLAKAEQLNSENPSTTRSEPTNTAINKRDRDTKTLTPLDQGSSKSDVEITAQIRKAILADKNMSVNAQNVKVITTNGQVTLRGPVKNVDEKRVIGEMAGRIVHSDHVDNQLDFKAVSDTN